MIFRCYRWLLRRWENFCLHGLLWFAKRLFPVIAAYIPDKETQDVEAVHMATCQRELNNSVRSYVDDLDEL